MSRRISRDLQKEFGRPIVKSRLVKGMGGFAEEIGGQSGGRASRSFWGNFTNGLLTPERGVVSALRTGVPAALGSPIGIAAVALATTFVGSFVAAVIGSGALALIGGAIAGLGGIALRENERVRSSFLRTARRIDSAFTAAAEGLAEPFGAAIDQVGSFFVNRLQPKIRSMFDQIAPAIGPLFEGASLAVENFLARIEPGIGRLTEEFLVPMADQLPRLGTMLGDFLMILIDNAPIFMRAFEGIVDLLELTLRILGPLLVSATNMFNVFAIGIRNSLIPMRLFQEQLNEWASNPVGFIIRQQGRAVEMLGGETDKTKRVFRDFSGESETLADALTDTTSRSERLAEAASGAAQNMVGLTREAGSLYEALLVLNGGVLAARAAERAFEGALDSAREALDEHGLSLDTNKESGRAVTEAVDGVVDAMLREADAVFKSKEETDGHKAAQAAANETLKEGRERLIDMLTPFFDSRKAAEEYVDEILNIPEEYFTDIDNNAGEAQDKIESLIREIHNIPKSREVTITTRRVNQAITREHGPGAQTVRRFGGVSYAQNGLINLGGRAFVAPDNANLFGFAERGTGGEAFIARNAPRDRSLAIMSEAARWHQAVVMPMERAATTMAASAPGPTGATQPTIIRETPIQIGDEVVRVVREIINEHESQSMTRRALQGVA